MSDERSSPAGRDLGLAQKSAQKPAHKSVRKPAVYFAGALLVIFGAGLLLWDGKAVRSLTQYLDGRGGSGRFELEAVPVRLQYSEEVKKGLSITHAALSIRQIVGIRSSQNESSPAGTPLDAREEILRPGQDTVTFPSRSIEWESASNPGVSQAVLSFQVVSRLEQPAGNCIQCEVPVIEAGQLAGSKKQEVSIRCEHWLAIGVCTGKTE